MASLAPSRSAIELMQCSNCQHVPLSFSGEGDRQRAFCSNCGQTYSVLECGAIDFLDDGEFFNRLTPAQVVAHNDLFAWSYERLWRGNALSILTGSSFSSQRESDLLNSWLEDADPILDLAAAAGYWSRMILQQRPDVTLVGLDNSAPLVAEAARQRRSQWPNYALVRANAEALPFANASFAAVTSGGSLNELPVSQTLAEVARVLKPGGSFISMHVRQVSDWGQIFQQVWRWGGLQFFSEADLRRQFDTVGLEVQRYLVFGAIVFVKALRS
ncbi:MAG: class I SAM-dependent methyltransferase [Cyanobacteria bacterium J06639_1]